MSAPVESDLPWFIPHSDDGDGWQTDFADRFLYYGTGGLYDPKNYTIEPWLLGGGTVGTTRAAWTRPTLAGFGRGLILSQAIAFVGFGLVGAVFDPLDRNEGGLDEHIGSLHDTKRNIDSFIDWWNNLPWHRMYI